jgi:anti-sigma factor RsiW
MNCQDIQDLLLTEFLDNEIGSDKKVQVDAHLAACPECREFYAAALNVDAAIKRRPSPEEPGPHVWGRICDAIQSRPESPFDVVQGWWEGFWGGYRPGLVYGSVAAALMVALVIVMPLALQRQQALAAADREELLQLVYADDENPEGWGSEQDGSGLVLDHWL